ncbi:MAG: hypothetical protein ACLR0U_04510 [Enterocloster clostridioformis]
MEPGRDLIVFDEQGKKWVAERFHSNQKIPHLLEPELVGKIKYTICSGQVVYMDREKIADHKLVEVSLRYCTCLCV